MMEAISRQEFSRRWLMILLVLSIFSVVMIGYVYVVENVFGIEISDKAIKFLIACTANIMFFIYIKWAAIPRMQSRRKNAIYPTVMHLPLIFYINVTLIFFELDAAALANIYLNILGIAGIGLAAVVFAEAVYFGDADPPASGRTD